MGVGVMHWVKVNRKWRNLEYSSFVYNCVVAVAGMDKTLPKLEKWNENSNINDIVSITDEAFALTLLVNYWDQYEAGWENKTVSAKFTERKLNKNGPNAKKMQGGWSIEGLNLFNELCVIV
jgi:hypothetical protein